MNRIAAAAERFAADWGLHGGEVPVDFSPCYDHFIPVYLDLTGQDRVGYAIFPPDDVGRFRPAKLYIHEGLSVENRRLVYAHELGHYICGHHSPLTTSLDGEHYDYSEREAWTAAAVLLIPIVTIQYGDTEEDVSERARVPLWLVRRYREVLV